MPEYEARSLLEAFVVDNPELERLESLLGQFNIFEAIGAVRQELRHSDFLAFLFDPRQPHGLGDAFAKRLLQRILVGRRGSDLPVSPIDFDVWGLDGMLVLREWENIDILLLDEPHQFAVIIENKIDSGEHSGQLSRYRESVRHHYPNVRTVGLYLTPDGDTPSDDSYAAVDYGLVARLVEDLVESRASTLGTDVRSLMTHYAQMLRRHIVSESEIAELCRRIYMRHQRALDLIYEHRPDQQAAVQEILEQLVAEQADLVLDQHSKQYIRFALSEWDTPALTAGGGWTPSGRMLLFQFVNRPDRLRLQLIIGPGSPSTRQLLLNAFMRTPKFGSNYKSLNQKWNTVFSRDFLTSKSYEDMGTDELEREIRKQWRRLLDEDLPTLADAARSVSQEPVATSPGE